MEATGNCKWFLELMAKLGHEVWIGDAAKIRASDARQQKHDKRDARLLLQLLMEQHFPQIWVSSREQKDLRQSLIHRYKLVRIRAQVKNGLQHLAMNQGLQKKKQLWSAAGQQTLRALPLQKSFVTRAARGCPGSAQATLDRSLDRALSSRFGLV